jgi:hypothetical protein
VAVRQHANGHHTSDRTPTALKTKPHGQVYSAGIKICQAKKYVMTQQMFARILTVKNLIRVAFTILSLNGMAHAGSPDNRPPPQSGNNYNYTAGGGG